MAAVQENWRALDYVEKQTEEMCIEAVKQNAEALKFVSILSSAILNASGRSPYRDMYEAELKKRGSKL